MSLLLEKGRAPAMRLVEIHQQKELTATERTSLLSEGTLLMKENSANPWGKCKKGVRLMEIGVLVEKDEFIDAAWLFLNII